MAFSTIIRRAAAASSSSLAIRVSQRRSFSSSALFPTTFNLLKNTGFSTELSRRRTTPHLPILRFSSLAEESKSSHDQILLQVIETEIKCAEEETEENRVEGVPNEFPFEIRDNPGEQTVSLRRDFHGQTIEVEVHMPLFDADDEEGKDDTSEQNEQTCIPLVVSVSKGNGPRLEFGCSASPDEISIDSMCVKGTGLSDEDPSAYEGPNFSDMNEELQKMSHKYLEVRGITPATSNFLHQYMFNKDSREYLMWLNKLKMFIEM